MEECNQVVIELLAATEVGSSGPNEVWYGREQAPRLTLVRGVAVVELYPRYTCSFLFLSVPFLPFRLVLSLNCHLTAGRKCSGWVLCH